MSEDAVKRILSKNPAGISKKELLRLSGLESKQLQSIVRSMLHKKELVLCSDRLTLNDMKSVKACLLDMNMESIYSLCDTAEISRNEINKDRVKAWTDAHVESMKWEDGRLVSKLSSHEWDLSDLHNIKEILA